MRFVAPRFGGFYELTFRDKANGVPIDNPIPAYHRISNTPEGEALLRDITDSNGGYEYRCTFWEGSTVVVATDDIFGPDATEVWNDLEAERQRKGQWPENPYVEGFVRGRMVNAGYTPVRVDLDGREDALPYAENPFGDFDIGKFVPGSRALRDE